MSKVPVKVELFYDAAWHDITVTEDVYTRDPITITRGRANEASRVGPSTLNLTIENRDGKYSPRNPRSPLFGKIGRNTPIRVSVGGVFRFHGEVESWPQRWSVDGKDVYAPIKANGIMRRLGAPGTKKAARSPLLRTITSQVIAPLVYYSLEEGANAVVPRAYGDGPFAEIPDYLPGTKVVTYAPGKSAPLGGVPVLYGATILQSVSSPQRRGVGIKLPVPDHTAGVEIVTMRVRWDPASDSHAWPGFSSADVNHKIEFVGGDIGIVRIELASRSLTDPTYLGGVAVQAFDNTVNEFPMGTPSDMLFNALRPVDDGLWHEVQVRLVQTGGDVGMSLYYDGEFIEANTMTGKTLGKSKYIHLGHYGFYFKTIAPSNDTVYIAPFEVGHVTVHTNAAYGQLASAARSYDGERAADRMTRLCAEEGVPFTLVGTAALTETLGPQTAMKFLDLMQEAADADGGILYESRAALGLVYRTHNSLYNQTPTLTLGYAAGDELAPDLAPVEDTATTANDVTVTRIGGGSARRVQEAGTLNVQDPADDPDGVGPYPIDPKLSLRVDDQCAPQASWRRHIGAWDEARYPVVKLDFSAMIGAGKNALKDAAASLDVGGRFEITSLPAWLPPEPIAQHAQGFTEVIESHHWYIDVNATPARPYNVGVLESVTWGRLDSRDSTANEAVDTSETDIDVAYVAVPWVTTASKPAQFPFGVMVGGERWTVTACRSYLNANPFFETDAANWFGNNGATIARSTAQFHEGVASLLITPDGVSFATQTTSEEVAVVAGTTYRLHAWLRSTTARTRKLVVFWYDSSHALLSSNEISIALSAGVWTEFGPTDFVAPVNAAFARVASNDPGMPGVGDTWYLDEATLSQPGRQFFTVIRSVNGIVKSHAAGTPVRLFTPLRLAR